MANAAILSSAVSKVEYRSPRLPKTFFRSTETHEARCSICRSCGEIGRAEDRNRVHVRRFVAIVRRDTCRRVCPGSLNAGVVTLLKRLRVGAARQFLTPAAITTAALRQHVATRSGAG